MKKDVNSNPYASPFLKSFSISACNQGGAPTSKCNDSDVTSQYPDGRNPYIKGIVIVGGKSYTDSCSTKYEVNEYFCKNNEKAFFG